MLARGPGKTSIIPLDGFSHEQAACRADIYLACTQAQAPQRVVSVEAWNCGAPIRSFSGRERSVSLNSY